MSCNVALCSEIELQQLSELLKKFGINIEQVADGKSIPGSWFG